MRTSLLRGFVAGALALASLACVPKQPAAPAVVPQAAQPAVAAPAPPLQPSIVTLNSPSPLLNIRLMVKAGSTADPEGKAGLASLTALSLLQGGYGDPANPVTKEKLADLTQPWGSGALPSVVTSGSTTTFTFTVPKDVLDTYIAKVLRPMLTQPLFSAAEIDRLRNEALSRISSLRSEDLESLGLAAIDEYVLAGTRYEHQPFGSEQTLKAITRDDVAAFYAAHYRPGNLIVGVSTTDPAVVDRIASVAREVNASLSSMQEPVDAGTPAAVNGREAIIIEQPNAPAASIHFGFPLSINRSDPDFWPLYVANVWFGLHRDSFGHLYQTVREERGYNYGDYSYLEFQTARPFSLFPPFNTPRKQQYFSVWIRPVAPEYTAHLMKGVTYELDQLVKNGLSDEEVAAAKGKAKVLYVNLGETVSRLLAAKMDDAFYGMTPGYLEGYLARIDAVTPQQVNAAIRKYLQTSNIKYLVVTDSKHAQALADELKSDRPAAGKTLADYQIQQVKLPDGKMAWQIPQEKMEMLQTDAVWSHYPLMLRSVRVVPVGSLFKSGSFVAE